MTKFLRKYHKWISIVFTIIILLFAVSGIILNHRNLLSGVDINRDYLPDNFSYSNWNNASVKATLKLSNDSILIYGNIGVWLTDSMGNRFTDFNHGFPDGIDNRKIAKIVAMNNGDLYAGTLLGLFSYNNGYWQKVELPVHEIRISDLHIKGDTLLVLTRSHLLATTDGKNYTEIIIPEPVNYDNKIGLFKTLWVIHSGEIYGETGKIIVDLFGIVLVFLTISGLYYFMNRLVIKKSKVNNKTDISKTNRWLLKWHNKVGWITLIFLIITSSTGIFLRPPFLIPIANSKVEKLPYSKLDSDNPWFDQLRTIYFDDTRNRYYLATSQGLFFSDNNLKSKMNRFPFQPPISIMGVTVFEKYAQDIFMIGSFEGLFLWDAVTWQTYDYIERKPFIPPTRKSRPLGNYLISGYTEDIGNTEVFFDYNHGAGLISRGSFPHMPEEISNQPISLWNVALEIHTGRIFESLLSDFYILIVPLTGLSVLFILISGFIVWWKLYRKKRRELNKLS